MKKAFLLILVMVLTFSADAQIIGSGGNRDDNMEIMNQLLKRMGDTQDEGAGYDGTPYLDSDFQIGSLNFPDKAPLTAQLRYNVVKEEIQVQFDDENYRVAHDGIVVQIGNDILKKYSYRGEDKSQALLGYFKVLTDNYEAKEVILLEKPYKKVKRGKAAAAMKKASPPKYLDRSDHYLKFAKSNSAVLAEKKTKNFVQIFPEEHRAQMEEYIKNNKLRPRKEQDLVHIVTCYNSNFGA